MTRKRKPSTQAGKDKAERTFSKIKCTAKFDKRRRSGVAGKFYFHYHLGRDVCVIRALESSPCKDCGVTADEIWRLNQIK